jgi:hypothetical protein
MAKVSTIKFEIRGVKYSLNVNCDSSGTFKVRLPQEVYEPLKLDKDIQTTTLALLEKEFHAALERYLNAETTQEIFIGIWYGSAGNFNRTKEGGSLFYDKYGIQISFSSGDESLLMFDHEIVMKETIDGVVTYWKTRKGKDFSHISKEYKEPEKWHKYDFTSSSGKLYDRDMKHCKLIPYSDAALASLQSAQEKIRSVSEMLFNFIEQDVKQIESTLTKTKFLN